MVNQLWVLIGEAKYFCKFFITLIKTLLFLGGYLNNLLFKQIDVL
jgi:hypothetical protein